MCLCLVPSEARRGIESPGTGVTNVGAENWAPKQEKPALLTVEPSLQLLG